MPRIELTRQRSKARGALTVLFGLVVAGILGLWIAGPPALQTGAYIQSVSATSVIIAKVDAYPRRLVVEVWPASAAEERQRVVEDEPVAVHAIRVDGLAPGTRYRFELTVEGEAASVGSGSFPTAPVADDVPVRFAAVGDSGELPWWYNMHHMGWSRIRPALALTWTPEQWGIATRIQATKPDFFVHLGDIVYWKDLRPAHEEAFFRPFAALLRDTPLFTVLGNHDIPKDGSVPPFQELFRNPSPPGVGAPQRNYSTAFGSVRLIALDVEDPAFETEPIRSWFEAQLAAASEPWLVVVVHKPCVSVYRPEYPELRDRLYPLLRRHGVDLVLSGDDHHYARFKPLAKDGPIQIVAGGGGKSLYDLDTTDPRLAAGAKAWSFVLIEAVGLRLTVRGIGDGAAVLDAFTIDRSRGELPATIHADRRRRIARLRK